MMSPWASLRFHEMSSQIGQKLCDKLHENVEFHASIPKKFCNIWQFDKLDFFYKKKYEQTKTRRKKIHVVELFQIFRESLTKLSETANLSKLCALKIEK